MAYVTTAALESERNSLAKQALQFSRAAGDFAAYGFYQDADTHRSAESNIHAEYVAVVEELQARQEIDFNTEAAEFLKANGSEATEAARKAAWRAYYALVKKPYAFPIAIKEAKSKALAYQNVLK